MSLKVETNIEKSTDLFDSDFPGADFEEQLCENAAAEKEVADRIAKMKRDIDLTHESRAFLELAGRDPHAETKALEARIRTAEGELQNCRHRRNQLFADGFARLHEVRNRIWVEINVRFIEPQAEALRECSRRIEDSIAQILGLQTDTTGTHAEQIRAFDDAIEKFRTLCVSHGAPGNVIPGLGDSLAVIVRSALQKNIRTEFQYERIAKLLRETMGQTPAKVL